jgi:hypothetical protein
MGSGEKFVFPACGAKFYFGFLRPRGRTIGGGAGQIQPGRELALRRGYIFHREFAARTPISAKLWPDPQNLAGAEQLKTAPNRCFLTRLAQNCCRPKFLLPVEI